MVWLVRVMLLAGALHLWLRDLSWWPAAGDVLPILAAFPLFWWCGRPWGGEGRGGLSWPWLVGGAGLWGIGMALDLPVVLALGWTLAAWSTLVVRLPRREVPVLFRLLPLLWLGFPWLVLEGEILGWWFRLTAARAVEVLFGGLGFSVAREGVMVLVQGLPVSVDTECSGMKVLQAMLLAGVVVAHRLFGRSRGFWWTLPLLGIAAWCANTLRVMVVTAVALTCGPAVVQGSLHAWGGVLVLVLMFILTVGLLLMLSRYLRPGEGIDHRNQILGAGIVVSLFALAMAIDLPSAWRHSPYDRLGGVAFLLWILPVLVSMARQLRQAGPADLAASLHWPVVALMLVMLGTVTSLHVVKHMALACAVAFFLPRGPWRAFWLLLAISWMPVLGWAMASCGAGLGVVHAGRLMLALLAVACGMASARQRLEAGEVAGGGVRRALWGGVPLLAVLATVAWEVVPLQVAASRVAALPAEGLGVSIRTIPLTSMEAELYQGVSVCKRSYRIGRLDTQVLIVDGSRNRHAVHDPTFCFRGAGWLVVNRYPVPLPGGEACALRLERSGIQQEALYWFTDGRSRHASAPRYWWQTSLRRLTMGLAGDEPLLVVVQPAGDVVSWEGLLDRLPGLLAL